MPNSIYAFCKTETVNKFLSRFNFERFFKLEILNFLIMTARKRMLTELNAS